MKHTLLYQFRLDCKICEAEVFTIESVKNDIAPLFINGLMFLLPFTLGKNTLRGECVSGT